MNTTKTLMLAAVTVLSLGVGTAMAQSDGPSAPETNYFWGQHQAAPQIIKNGWGQVQSGSSDADPLPGGTAHFDYGDLANPG
jgi:hypothetical protein